MSPQKEWKIPTILRELRRVVLEAEGRDIMDPINIGDLKVTQMVSFLTTHNMVKEMEQIPGQTSIPVPKEKDE
jgi:hypothetical protein